MEGGWKGREGGRDGGQKRTKRSNGTGKEERNRGVRYRRERKRERETGETGGRIVVVERERQKDMGMSAETF